MSDYTKQASLILLYKADEICVCDLVEALDFSQPKVSRHLADLRKCGMVSDKRHGRWVFYRLNPDLPAWAKQIIEITYNGNRRRYEDMLTRLCRVKELEGQC